MAKSYVWVIAINAVYGIITVDGAAVVVLSRP